MKYVHSLVKVTANRTAGWMAPAEIEGDSPQSVAFVIPLEQGEVSEKYHCELVQIKGPSQRSLVTSELFRVGDDSFALDIAGQRYRFHTRPVGNREHCLEYIGRLSHPDFKCPFVEIEPDSQAALDKLCEDAGVFVIGCDPFEHYQGAFPLHSASEVPAAEAL